MSQRHDIWKVADAIQMDLRATQAKMVELRSYLAGLNLPSESAFRCSECQSKFHGPQTLAEHLYTSHGGPVPTHWLRVDELAKESA